MIEQRSFKPFRWALRVWRPALFTALTSAVFWPRLRGLWALWWNDGFYSLGFLVVPVAMLLAFCKRQRLDTIERRPSFWGAVLYVIGVIATAYLDRFFGPRFTSITALLLITCITGAIGALQGFAVAKLYRFEIGFLLFMVPVPPNVLALLDYPLQELGAQITTALGNHIGISLARFGTTVVLSGTTMTITVAPQCNGMRSTIAMLGVAVLHAHLCDSSWQRKAVLVAAALPLAYLANILRLAGIIVAGSAFGPTLFDRYEQIWDHISGFILFGGAVALLFAVGKLVGCDRFREIG